MYQYKAYTLDKQIVEGVIDVPTENAAEERLSNAGFSHILTLKKTSPPFTLERIFPQLFSVQKADIVDVFGQLATLLDARVPFIQALWILSEQTKRAALKKIIRSLGQQVSGGIPFSRALAEYPKLVSSQYCQVIAVSEKSGDLPAGLKLVAGYMEKELSLGSSVKRMLSYPAFLVVMSIFVILMVAIVAMPSLVKLFSSLHVGLPLTTRIFIGLADFIIVYKFHMILGIMSLVLCLILLWKTPSVRRALDRIVLKTPVIGSVIIMRCLCRICRTASMLTEAGLTLPQSLNAVIGIIDNDVIKKIMAEVRQDVIKGKGLSRQLARYPVFPRMLVDVMAIGEKTGTLQSSFTSMADHYEKKLDLKVKKLMGLIEPVSIIAIGLIISFIGISILQPLYSIYQNLG